MSQTKVQVRVGALKLPTYLPMTPDKNPMFLEKRVYQGSSGKVYPLPFTDRISDQAVARNWKAIWIENEFLRVLVLPEIGGRIHAILDKTNGYDLIYNQQVIKPALVGLAGPWVSGGIEFNWPQHHRPATFLPVDFEVEKNSDGSATVWCSDHDPMVRMKGMHGVCVHPGRAYVELKVRAYNRTPFTQTFLWWANVATRVHEAYQSFFPPDVNYVADHARRSMSEYPRARGRYYGVDYGNRGRNGIPKSEVSSEFVPPHAGGKSPVNYAPNDLSFYANIPVPTSYMCMGSKEDFFGGYDYRAEAGIVHVANHHIAPGKKQWTWGNHEFGYAWDRNLTEPDAKGEFGPYIEIMAGVYTDNQPDFSFLQPGETKTWSQFWYPIQKIGPAQTANREAAVSLRFQGRSALLGVATTQSFPGAKIQLSSNGRQLLARTCVLRPGKPFVAQVKLPSRISESKLVVRVVDAGGTEIIACRPKQKSQAEIPPPASEPAAPAHITSTDELFTIGLHLEQYRHATRFPTLYWQEALRRDPLDVRCNNAMGRWHLKRGEFGVAEKFFRRAIERLTSRNANPYDGEAFYHLGLCLRYQDRTDAAYDAFYKACWNQAWMAAGYHALAEIDCTRGQWLVALDHLHHALRFNTDNLRARNLLALVLRKLGRTSEAAAVIRQTLTLDPLDWWARHLQGQPLNCDLQVALDLMHDCARAGVLEEAKVIFGTQTNRCLEVGCSEISGADLPTQSWGAMPLLSYTLGWMLERSGDTEGARAACRRASTQPADFCFPARLEEIGVFETAMRLVPQDPKAPYYLGNLFYDRCRHEEAIQLWERSARLDPNFSVVWRNLGIGYFNIRKNPTRARAAYEKALTANPTDARLLYERDQLWKRLGEKPVRRRRVLESHVALVQQRDDLSVELCALYNQTGASDKALTLVSSRRFQPWEGGEGGPLGQWVRSHLSLGRQALERGEGCTARDHFTQALTTPTNLGEGKHLLTNQSDIHYWLGCALAACGDVGQARHYWQIAAAFKGDFQEMSVRAYSEMTYYSALAWQKLGRRTNAKNLFRELLAYAQQLENAEAKIDYFATSLPTMLLFDDDLQFRQVTSAKFLQAQAWLGLGKRDRAKTLLVHVLKRDPNHAMAADLFSSSHSWQSNRKA